MGLGGGEALQLQQSPRLHKGFIYLFTVHLTGGKIVVPLLC